MDENGTSEQLEAWNPKRALAALAGERDLAGEDKSMTQVAETLLEENLPQAVLAIVHMSQHSPNERIRLNAAQYIVDRNLGKITDQGMVGDSDPLERLLGACVKNVDEELKTLGGASGEG
jgi:hypothetical protein